MTRVVSCTAVAAFLLFPACNQAFDPQQEFQLKLVVFSILSTDRVTQYVRVEQNYVMTKYDPSSATSDLAVKDAIVEIRDGALNRRFTDTTLVRPDTSRYGVPIWGYVLRDFPLVPGGTYQLTVTSPSLGQANASVTIPTKPAIGFGAVATAVLDNPLAYSESDIACSAVLSPTAKGFHSRLFIDFDVLVGSEWHEGRIEIPLSYRYPKLKSFDFVLYPQLTARPARNQVGVSFTNEVYQAALTFVTDRRHKGRKLIFKWAVFHFMQLEKNLFNYYSVTHSYRDAHSMRLDEPLISNVAGGYGLFGAYTADSLVHLLPENFSYNVR